MKSEQIEWVTDGTLPADGVLVLIEVLDLATDGKRIFETDVLTGFLDGEVWRDCGAVPVQRVVAWADMPKGTRGVR